MDTIPQTMFTRWALERFATRKAQCALIDLASVAASVVVKSTAVYCAAKTYNKFLSLGLSATKMTMPDKYNNIDFMALCPGPVATKLQQGSYFGRPQPIRQY